MIDSAHMKILYFDCFAGISGDMALGAFLDMGVDKNVLIAELEKLGLKGWHIATEKDSRGGVFGTKATVELEHHHCGSDSHSEHHHEHCHHNESHHNHHHSHHSHNSWREIRHLIKNSEITESAKKYAIKMFSLLAEAEAQIHGKDVEDVMFHEVGAVDSIIDIVGTAICIDLLKPDLICSSVVELGSGTVKCAHGIMPVPAPATAILSKNFKFKMAGASHECTTPTGATIIAALCQDKKIPQAKLQVSGIGIGQRNCPELPNFLRVSIFESTEVTSTETLCEFAANIDDMTAEELAFAQTKIFEAKALDVWQENIVMKKNRLAIKLCALSKLADTNKILEAYFKHTTTLGVRQWNVERTHLNRSEFDFKSSIGSVKMKKSTTSFGEKIKAEFDDISKIADSNNISIFKAKEIIYGEFKQKPSK